MSGVADEAQGLANDVIDAAQGLANVAGDLGQEAAKSALEAALLANKLVGEAIEALSRVAVGE